MLDFVSFIRLVIGRELELALVPDKIVAMICSELENKFNFAKKIKNHFEEVY